MNLVAYLDGGIDAFVAAARIKELRFPLHLAAHIRFAHNFDEPLDEMAACQAEHLGLDLTFLRMDVVHSTLDVHSLNTMKVQPVPHAPHGNLLIASCIANYMWHTCDGLVFGWHPQDVPAPDNTIEFQRALSHVLNVGGGTPYTVHLPLMMYTAEEIGEMGIEQYNLPLADMTWSCSKQIQTHCGVCYGCILRKRVFGGGDTTEYSISQ